MTEKPDQDIYSAQMLESLSDVVDTMNEAKADDLIFNFQIGQSPDGKFALASLSCTKMMPVNRADRWRDLRALACAPSGAV